MLIKLKWSYTINVSDNPIKFDFTANQYDFLFFLCGCLQAFSSIVKTNCFYIVESGAGNAILFVLHLSITFLTLLLFILLPSASSKSHQDVLQHMVFPTYKTVCVQTPWSPLWDTAILNWMSSEAFIRSFISNMPVNNELQWFETTSEVPTKYRNIFSWKDAIRVELMLVLSWEAWASGSCQQTHSSADRGMFLLH